MTDVQRADPPHVAAVAMPDERATLARVGGDRTEGMQIHGLLQG
jgi:hypothetical protein